MLVAASLPLSLQRSKARATTLGLALDHAQESPAMSDALLHLVQGNSTPTISELQIVVRVGPQKEQMRPEEQS
jgi:hypothetical protein